MRLIDADALCRHLSDWQFGAMTDGKHNAEYEVINKVIDGIEKEPTVDAVPVVRCKNCKWSERTDLFLLCGAWDARAVDDNDFCSYGERRSE